MTIKRRFLLTGDYENNCGPCNVNRSLVMNADEAMDYVRAKSRLTKKIKRICKLLRYHTIVISGGLADMEVELARLLGKRIIYIMHGYSSYEYIINKLELPPVVLEREQRLLRYADKIVAVSANYAKWVKRQIPEYASKVTFVNNGLELVDNYPPHTPHNDAKWTIAVSGGNRPIKNNLTVCKAVEKLIAEGMDITVLAFGLYHDNGEPIFDYPFVRKMGQMNKEEYYSCLHTTDLYVIASVLEPFGLVVGDALNCGCSLLLSKQVGALSIFAHTEDSDVLQNHLDVEEMARKIKHLLKHGNAERLFFAVDKEQCSAHQAYLSLKKICLDE